MLICWCFPCFSILNIYYTQGPVEDHFCEQATLIKYSYILSMEEGSSNEIHIKGPNCVTADAEAPD